jgi:hypothetical protein
MTYELAEEAIALSIERWFALRLAEKTMLRGWALVEQGQGGQVSRRYVRGWPPTEPQGRRRPYCSGWAR